jgi:hypothetical protein
VRTRRGTDAVLITSAQQSRLNEIRDRQRRYAYTMAFRTVCFVLAVLLLNGFLQFVAIAVSLVLPWIAVVVANGGPKRSQESPSLYQPVPKPTLPPAGPAPRPRVVDHD